MRLINGGVSALLHIVASCRRTGPLAAIRLSLTAQRARKLRIILPTKRNEDSHLSDSSIVSGGPLSRHLSLCLLHGPDLGKQFLLGPQSSGR